jgi:hypothetical protein
MINCIHVKSVKLIYQGKNCAGEKKVIRVKDSDGNGAKLEVWSPRMEQIVDGESYQITNLKVNKYDLSLKFFT